jgi:hypothetical protein
MLRPEERKKAKQFETDILNALRDVNTSLQSLADEKIRAVSDTEITTRITNTIQNSEALRSVTDRLDALVAQQETERQKQERRFQNRSLFVQWALFIATAGAFVAAAVYAHVAAQQKDAMENTLAEVIKQTGSADISAKAAKRAAEIAGDTLTSAQRSFIVQERAYMAVKSAAKEGPVDRTQAKFRLVFANSGLTPALRATNFGSCAYYNTFPTVPATKKVGGEATIRPNGGELHFLPISDCIPGKNWDLIAKHEITLYVYGIVRYEDVFGCRRWTQYCTAFDPDRPDQMNVCEHWNDSDDPSKCEKAQPK